ncbi:hypothetical protein [Metabacillus litoralis]|uniref:hypothetical protein n=1 Tax=Metabacillus litoralis TaxID=152268 RepID=UPI001CFF5108|nr:hypothetical protein [Metabacillus litoralis]
MVKCHDRKYRTANPKYVDVSPKPSDWHFEVRVEGITHIEARKIVNLIQSNFEGINVYGVPK